MQELQRKELESLLESPTQEKQKEAQACGHDLDFSRWKYIKNMCATMSLRGNN